MKYAQVSDVRRFRTVGYDVAGARVTQARGEPYRMTWGPAAERAGMPFVIAVSDHLLTGTRWHKVVAGKSARFKLLAGRSPLRLS